MAKITAIFCLILAMIQICQAWKLNVPRVLMPIAEEGSNFMVYSDDGCFTWTSTRPEVVKIIPKKLNGENGIKKTQEKSILPLQIEDGQVSGCTSAAVIHLSPHLETSMAIAKTQAIVTAENAHDRILRCDVIVDRIQSLQIVTKTLELFLEEAPEEFTVRAFNDQGSEFSSLDGLVFIWSLESNSVKGENIKFIKFRDSDYAIDSTLEKMEAKGLQGSKVLLEGIRTGSSKVMVKLASKHYEHVPPAKVTVNVVANLFVAPHPAFVIQGGAVDYHAEQMKSNRFHRIDLSNSQQYYVRVGSEELAYNHPKQLETIVAGQKIGETEIFLRDNNVGKDDVVKSPSADLHIVPPAYINIDINPYNNWNVIIGKDYDLHISVFDQKHHKLFPSSNLISKLEIEEGYFEIDQVTQNGTWLTGKPLKVGTAWVKAVLLGTKDVVTGDVVDLVTPLHAKAELLIFEPIVIKPNLSIFPWDPLAHQFETVSYSVLGTKSSTLSFIWSSGNSSIATVTQNGIGKTLGKIGESAIIAAMNRATHNRGEATILVVPVVGLEILKDRILEVEVGSTLALPLRAWGKNDMKFTKCDQIPFKTAIADSSILKVTDTPAETEAVPEEACTQVLVQGLHVGFSKVIVSYTYSLDGKPVKLSDSITIAVYDPLEPLQPHESSTVVLAVGSSLDIVWSGGPQPWIFKPEEHFHNLELKESVVEVKEEQKSNAGGIFVYRIVCSQLGETEVELSVGNTGSHSLPRPITISSIISIICADPDRIQLEARPVRPDGLTCPMIAKTNRVASLCDQDLRIEVSVLDSAGRKFDNFSTVDISWDNSDLTLGELELDKGMVLPDHPTIEATNYLPFALAKGYQILHPKGKPGTLDITTSLKKSSYLMGRSISDVLQLQLVEEADIVPKKISLFNHPENFLTLNVLHGSGFFDISTADVGSIVTHKYTGANRSVQLSPIKEGITTVKAQDMCLSSEKSATSFSTAQVNVIGIHKVELKVIDKVQLGTQVVAQVQLWDQFGESISLENIKKNHLEITVSPTNKEIASIESQNTADLGKLTFKIKGSLIGQTSLTATALYGSKRVNSKAVPFQVFPPLELEPRNVTLIIGAQFQVQVFGGPGQTDSNLEYSLGHVKIASSDPSGLISALTLGSTRLTAKSIGIDGSTGEKVVLSSDTIDVHVVKLTGIKIKTPVVRMRVGSEIPLSAVGLDENNQDAFSFGSALPNLMMSWSLSNQNVAKLVSPFWRNGLEANNKNNGVMRLIAYKPGRTTIHLNTKITAPIDNLGQYQLDKDFEVTHQLDIVIFDNLVEEKHNDENNVYLMAPQSEFQLKINRDRASNAKIVYSVLPTVVGQDPNEIISVSKMGKISAKRTLGSAVVFVQVTEENAVTQKMSLTVHVKSVTYLMLNALKVVKPVQTLDQWPLGLKLPLEITFHDEYGTKFDAVEDSAMIAALNYRPNRFDTNLIKVGNNSLAIELVQSGFTVLKTMVGQLKDFLIFDVETAIDPAPKSIGVGDVLLLDSLVTSELTGTWNVKPQGMMSFDATTGLAVALRTGLARISYDFDEERSTVFDVIITKAQKIQFLSDTVHLTNVKNSIQAVSFDIVSNDETGNLKIGKSISDTSSIQGQKFPKELFVCDAKFVQEGHNLNDVFHVQSAFYKGHYACLLTTMNENVVLSDDIEISVIPNAGLGLSVITSQTVVPFSSAFKLVSSSPMLLTNVEPQMEIILTGLDTVLANIEITANDPHYIHVGRGYAKTEDSMAWIIGLKSAFWTEAKPGSELSVSVSTSVTGQTQAIPINVIFRGDECGNIELGWSVLFYFIASNYQPILFILASCLICIFLTKLIYQSQNNKSDSSKTQNSSAFANGHAPSSNGVVKLQQNGNGGLMSTPLTSDAKPYLWTTNESPVYGSPTSTSPLNRKSPRNLTQYSYDR